MATFAVISDVHANLEALEAVLGQVRGTDLYCLGDLVDYGANPNEVVETVRKEARMVIMGNHDMAATTGDTSQFNARAAISSKWTAKTLTGSNMDYLRGLPREWKSTMAGVPTYFAHGSPDDQLWEYVDPSTHRDLFGHYLTKLSVGLIGLGHTHVPYVWREPNGVVFNPGSVGQPRDGDPRASWALVTIEGDRVGVEVRRVQYDTDAAASRIRRAGLPEAHADRLSKGL
jgi:predicted phosphodiesterase